MYKNKQLYMQLSIHIFIQEDKPSCWSVSVKTCKQEALIGAIHLEDNLKEHMLTLKCFGNL